MYLRASKASLSLCVQNPAIVVPVCSNLYFQLVPPKRANLFYKGRFIHDFGSFLGIAQGRTQTTQSTNKQLWWLRSLVSSVSVNKAFFSRKVDFSSKAMEHPQQCNKQTRNYFPKTIQIILFSISTQNVLGFFLAIMMAKSEVIESHESCRLKRISSLFFSQMILQKNVLAILTEWWPGKKKFKHKSNQITHTVFYRILLGLLGLIPVVEYPGESVPSCQISF